RVLQPWVSPFCARSSASRGIVARGRSGVHPRTARARRSASPGAGFVEGSRARGPSPTMNRVLRFKPHLRVELAGEGNVFLVGENDHFLLKGRLHELVAPLVDGRRTEWEIIEALQGKASPPEVYYTLTTLEQRGYLCEVSTASSPEAAAFWSSLGV